MTVVEVAWHTSYDATVLLRGLAAAVTGADPGPLHHHCPTCGSVEHGAPGYDDPSLSVSIARAPGLTLVALTTGPRIGVDVEQAGPDRQQWTRHEAQAKAHGTGIVADHGPADWVLDLDLPDGYVGAVAGFSPQPEVRAAPTRTATS